MGVDGSPTVAQIRTLLAMAYVDDPLMVWLFPDSTTRLDACAAWLGLFVEADTALGLVDHRCESGGLEAVALWRMPRSSVADDAGRPDADRFGAARPSVARPGAAHPSAGPSRAVPLGASPPRANPPKADASATSLPSIRGLFEALAGAEHAAKVTAALAELRSLTPAEPRAYLHFMAVLPGRQGRGLGRELLDRGLERAQLRGLTAHCETTNPRAVGFYTAAGFAVSGHLTLAHEGPEVWALTTPTRP